MEKVDKILKTFYNHYEEENRFKKSNHNKLEFITTILTVVEPTSKPT